MVPKCSLEKCYIKLHIFYYWFFIMHLLIRFIDVYSAKVPLTWWQQTSPKIKSIKSLVIRCFRFSDLNWRRRRFFNIGPIRLYYSKEYRKYMFTFFLPSRGFDPRSLGAVLMGWLTYLLDHDAPPGWRFLGLVKLAASQKSKVCLA